MTLLQILFFLLSELFSFFFYFNLTFLQSFHFFSLSREWFRMHVLQCEPKKQMSTYFMAVKCYFLIYFLTYFYCLLIGDSVQWSWKKPGKTNNFFILFKVRQVGWKSLRVVYVYKLQTSMIGLCQSKYVSIMLSGSRSTVR